MRIREEECHGCGELQALNSQKILNPERKNRKMQQLYSIKASAVILAISPWTVRAFIRKGSLKPVRIGRRVLLEESELERFVAEGKTEKA